MILECHRALTGMPPFVVVMEEGRYGLRRLLADDDDVLILGESWEQSEKIFRPHKYTHTIVCCSNHE